MQLCLLTENKSKQQVSSENGLDKCDWAVWELRAQSKKIT